MCGISGEITFSANTLNADALGRVTESMRGRGPDASGLIIRDRVAFGHCRLTIIDKSILSEQPMVDSELGLMITFNGCIYNYMELRLELQRKGYKFFSNGDTEVILKAWHAWGVGCLSRFYGMFAFAIYERDSGKLILARDRLGIKPLYYVEAEGKFLRFASSLTALLSGGDIDTSIDRIALNYYMTLHAIVPPPRTIIKGIKKIPNATVRVIESNGRTTDTVYWTPTYTRTIADVEIRLDIWRDRLLDRLRSAVKRHMVADVPVGVLLSGGLDSSLIVGLLIECGQTNISTFSIGFEEANGEKGDEFVYSDFIAEYFGTDHHKFFVSADRLIESLPHTIKAMSEPMASHDNVGFFLLSKEVAKHVRAVQSGQGADEVFAGYHYYQSLAESADPVADYAKVFFDRDRGRICAHLNHDWLTDTDDVYAFVDEQFAKIGAESAIDKVLRLDTTVFLAEDPVKRLDNMTMAWGIEARVPFLDHELVELAAIIPPEYKLAQGGKGILKEAARTIIPHKVIDREKGYFPVPALKYLGGSFLKVVRDALSSQAAKDRRFFKENYLEELFGNPNGHITPLRGSELWQIAVLELWLQMHKI